MLAGKYSHLMKYLSRVARCTCVCVHVCAHVCVPVCHRLEASGRQMHRQRGKGLKEAELAGRMLWPPFHRLEASGRQMHSQVMGGLEEAEPVRGNRIQLQDVRSPRVSRCTVCRSLCLAHTHIFITLEASGRQVHDYHGHSTRAKILLSKGSEHAIQASILSTSESAIFGK